MTAWRDYQEQAAEFFRKLGMDVEVEGRLAGVRGTHIIDVVARGSHLGIDFTWIVECKAWTSNVPKEKVAALISILQDVGADRGFLLSERGFQSGALRMAEKSNVTLTSLADLSEVVGDKAVNVQIANLHSRIHTQTNRLREIKMQFYDDEFASVPSQLLWQIFLLPRALDDAIAGRFPSPYTPFGPDQKSANSLEEMIAAADEILRKAEAWERPS